jgi:DNA-directed RNA polymerase specialized sigma24 family protein
MASGESATRWLGRLRAGDEEAAQKLWERYFRRLVGLARRRLQGHRQRVEDEEDVALGAFASFCRGARAGRFSRLRDRHNLWPLLMVLTLRKAHDAIKHERARKRGGGAVRGESALIGAADGEPAFAEILGREPTPSEALAVAEECRRLLDLLGAADLRTVALGKLEGYTNAEIAAQLGCVPETVERKLRVIRTIWSKENRP